MDHRLDAELAKLILVANARELDRALAVSFIPNRSDDKYSPAADGPRQPSHQDASKIKDYAPTEASGTPPPPR